MKQKKRKAIKLRDKVSGFMIDVNRSELKFSFAFRSKVIYYFIVLDKKLTAVIKR